MSKKPPGRQQQTRPARKRTPTFLLELPLLVDEGQATRIRGHLEAGRALYNAVLSEGLKRLRRMRADPGWQAARALPLTQPQERRAAFAALRQRILRAIDQGKKQVETAETFAISTATIKRYLKARRARGHVLTQPIPGRPGIKEAALQTDLLDQLEANPDATREQHCQM